MFLSLSNLEPNKYYKTDKTTFEMLCMRTYLRKQIWIQDMQKTLNTMQQIKDWLENVIIRTSTIATVALSIPLGSAHA